MSDTSKVPTGGRPASTTLVAADQLTTNPTGSRSSCLHCTAKGLALVANRAGVRDGGDQRRVGIALGVVTLGSVGTAVYRGQLAAHLPGGVPAAAAQATREALPAPCR